MAKHICVGGVRAVCLYSQPSMVRGDVAVVSGPSRAETGELTPLSKDGIVVSVLQGGASCTLGSVPSIYIAPAPCAHAGLVSTQSHVGGIIAQLQYYQWS